MCRRLGALTVKQECKLSVQERLGEIVSREMRTDKSTVSTHYGLEIPKAPVLVPSSAGDSPMAGHETSKGSVRRRRRCD
jgi:hypothetical protein